LSEVDVFASAGIERIKNKKQKNVITIIVFLVAMSFHL
jgi:hypothetical protein